MPQNTVTQTIKICGRCGDPFACRAGGCWCTSLWIPAAVLEALRKNYTDCLCPQCLREIAARARHAAAPPLRFSPEA